MALFFENWDSSTVVTTLGSVVSFLAAGFLLGCMCWLVGYLVVSLFRMLKGGV